MLTQFLHRCLCLVMLIVSGYLGAQPNTTTTPSLLPPDAQMLHFDGQDAYLQFTPWQAKDKHRIVAWVEGIEGDWIYLVSGTKQAYLAINHNSFKGLFAGKLVEFQQQFDFANTGYIEITLSPGKITVSDGNVWISRNNPVVQNQAYRYAMRFKDNYSRADLQGLKLIEYRAPENSLVIHFQHQRIVSSKTAKVERRASAEPQWRQPSLVVQSPPPLLATQEEWDQQFHRLYPEQRPLLNRTEGNDRDRFTWHGHYWLRAYLIMAETYDDEKYLDYAIELIDHIFYYSDHQRQNRDELQLDQTPYNLAPRPYLEQPQQAAPGWRRPYQGMRIEVLSDGHILNGILRVVDYIKRSGNRKYKAKADEYLELAYQVIRSHQTAFSSSKLDDVAGSYYYTNRNSNKGGDAGLHPTPVPFNHSLTMAVAKIYTNYWLPEPDPELERQIRQISQFFSDNVEHRADGSCRWHYRYLAERTEDVNHAHIDVGFITVAERFGYIDERIAQCAATTIAKRVFRAPGVISDDLDGKGFASPSEQLALSLDWLELAEYDPRLITMNRHLLRHYGKPNWSRALFGWASLLKWEQKLAAKPSKLADKESSIH